MTHSELYNDIMDIIKFSKKLVIESSKDQLLINAEIDKLNAIISPYLEGEKLTAEEKKEINNILGLLNLKKDDYIKENTIKGNLVWHLNNDLKKKISAASIGFICTCTAMSGSIYLLTGCSKSNEKEETTISNDETKKEVKTVKKEKVQNKMSEESEVIVNNVANAMNQGLASGIEIIEDEKEDKDHTNTKTNMTRLYTNYYLVANMNEVSDLEWGSLFQEKTISAEDMIADYFVLNTAFKKQLITAKSDQQYDFSNLYVNEDDNKMLNEFASKIARLNETSGSEREQISREIRTYLKEDILEYFNSSTGKTKGFNTATLDTIVTMSEAWDELTRDSGYSQGAYLDDELEASINREISICFANYGIDQSQSTNIDINKIGMRTYLDMYRPAILEKIEAKNVAGINALQLDIAKGNELNKLDEIENIREEIKKKIDLSLYKALPNYEEYLKNLYGISETPQKSKDDSGVSNGTGGINSASDMAAYGATTNEEYQQKKEEEFENNANNNVIYDGQYDSDEYDPAKRDYYAQKGADDALAGKPKDTTVPEQYKNAYNAAYDAVKKSIEDARNNTETTNEFQGVDDNQPTQVETEEEIHDYTDESNDNTNNNSNNQSQEEFIPVDEGQEEIIDEEIEIEDYVTAINNLTEARDYLNSLIETEELENTNGRSL